MTDNKEITYTVFAITDVTVGKACFVGTTGRPVSSIEDEILRHRRARTALAAALAKEPDRFRFKVLEEGVSRDDRRAKRLGHIKRLRTFAPHGYNKLGS